MAKLDEPMVHECGQSFTYTQSYAKHAKECDGTKPATSGRIAAQDSARTPPARKRSAMPRRKASAKRVKRAVAPRTTAVPKGDVEAIAWAITQKPEAWEVGEWLARILPEGTWSLIEGQELADRFVGAAIRARDEQAPE